MENTNQDALYGDAHVKECLTHLAPTMGKRGEVLLQPQKVGGESNHVTPNRTALNGDARVKECLTHLAPTMGKRGEVLLQPQKAGGERNHVTPDPTADSHKTWMMLRWKPPSKTPCKIHPST